MIVVLLAFLALAAADTPANCTYESIVGSWVFNIGPGGNDNTLNCSVPFVPVQQYEVTLTFPDTAVDVYGNTGFFTLIYNQGFEVVINGMKFFAFSYYEQTGNVVTDYCSTTFAGWAHAIDGSNWACYKGLKTETNGHTSKTISATSSSHSSSLTGAAMNMKYQRQKEYVDLLNSYSKPWTAQVYSEYDGLTIGQLQQRAGGNQRNPFPKDLPFRTPTSVSEDPLPTAFDWSDVDGIDYVSPVRNQGGCGSCYAFGAQASYEARVRVTTNNTLQPILSPQDVLSCCNYSQGCAGGFPYLMGKYGADFGFVEESCNPYLAADTATCTTNQKCSRWVVDTTSYHYIGGFYGACNPELMMIELFNNGPITVCFQVYNDFLQYKGGVYVHGDTNLDGFNPWQEVNHAVSIVGWGVDPTSTLPYWRVKNSWGSGWGEEGYFRILRNANECSIESIAVAFTPITTGH